MKQQVVCEVCQGELLKQENVFICQHCGIKYSIEEVKRMLTEMQLKEKKLKDEDRLKEEQKLKEEAERLKEAEKQRLIEEQKQKERQRLKEEEEQKIIAEEQRLMAEEKRLKEEEQRLKDEKERLKELMRLKEEKRLMEEQRLKEEERQKEEQRLKEEHQKIVAEEQKLKEEKERLKEAQRLKEEERQREEQRLKEEHQKIIAEEQKLKEEKERLTGKLRVIAVAPQEEAPPQVEAPQEEVAEEAPPQVEAPKLEAPQEEAPPPAPQPAPPPPPPPAPPPALPASSGIVARVAQEISKEDEKSIFDEPAKEKKGFFLYFIIIIFLLAIIAYFAKPYYIDYINTYYDQISGNAEKENENAVVKADTLQQNSGQNLGVSDSIKKPSDTIVAKEVQDESKMAKKTEPPKKNEPPKKRTEAEKQIDDDVAQAIAAVLKSESNSEPEPVAPKPISEPKAKVETPKGNFYKTSFNCEKTNNATALTICTNEELARLDVQMNKLYQPLALAYEEEQKEWRKNLGKCKADINCLDRMYRDRIKFLKDAQ